MNITSCVRHRANTRFFIKHEDILDLCSGDQAKCAAHRVLEVKTNNRIMALREAGHNGDIPEEKLWFTMHWDDFSYWSMHDREKSSFRTVLPRIQADGHVRSRYVKEDEQGQVICDDRGRPYTYKDYKEAQADHAVDGLIVIQYLYLYKKVNAALDKLSPHDGGDTDEKREDVQKSGQEAEDATSEGVTSNSDASSGASSARGGNLRDAVTCSDTIITPCQKQQGGVNGLRDGDETPCQNEQDPPVENDTPSSFFGIDPCQNRQDPCQFQQDPPCQNRQDPPVEIDSNKNLLIESTFKESTRTTAESRQEAAVVMSLCLDKKDETTVEPEEIWTVEAILSLAGQYLEPLPTYISKQQQAANQEAWRAAAQTIRNAPYFTMFAPEDAIMELDDILNFVSHPESPSWWSKNFAALQHKAVRLWHVGQNYMAMAQDLRKHGWMRSEETPPTWMEEQPAQVEPSADPAQTTPTLPTTEPLHIEPTEPQGMTESEAIALLSEIRASHSAFFPRMLRVPGRLGYKVELNTSPGRTAALYCEDAWREMVESWKAAPKPSERLRAMMAQRKAG